MSSRIFISYARENTSFTHKLNHDLQRRGVNTWIDVSDIRMLEDWTDRIAKAIESCTAMLVILSPASIQSDWVWRELILAAEQKKTLIPLIYDKCNIPLNWKLLFGDVQWADFTQNEYEPNLDELLNSLHAILGIPVVTTSHLKKLYLLALEYQQAERLNKALKILIKIHDLDKHFETNDILSHIERIENAIETRKHIQLQKYRRVFSRIIAGIEGLLLIVFLSQSTPKISSPPESLFETPTIPEAKSETLPSHPSENSSPNQLPEFIIDEKGVTMVLVPAGEFQMGMVHTTTLDDFYIDQYEVTNRQFAEFINSENYLEEVVGTWLDTKSADLRIQLDESTSTWLAQDGYEDHPVVEINWYGAIAYCSWRSARLPTEAEWEKTAMSIDGNLYPWGNQFDDQKVNFCDQQCGYPWANENYDDGYANTAPVGVFPNGMIFHGNTDIGVYDLAGNVWEWVAKPKIGDLYILRGGSWFNDKEGVRTISRSYAPPNETRKHFGFRCALSP